jgi:hypothetical protein
MKVKVSQDSGAGLRLDLTIVPIGAKPDAGAHTWLDRTAPLEHSRKRTLRAAFGLAQYVRKEPDRHWLGRLDSNQGMPESKSGALPLGYAPMPAW